ncbi:MAG: hypothetical protein KGV50_06065 [Gammaproteobacteria bacterium]|nr:hypothetical protein [Gammaproteobacteria bacterium]
MIKKSVIISLAGLALLSACTFDNDSGQFAIDLNDPDNAQSAQQPEPAIDITGVYQSMPTKVNARFEKMRITRLDEQRYEVSITTPGADGGCQFKAAGNNKFGYMLIPLNSLNADLHSTMAIQFTANKATVDTTKPAHFNDLARFCGLGRSLVGGYHKVP